MEKVGVWVEWLHPAGLRFLEISSASLEVIDVVRGDEPPGDMKHGAEKLLADVVLILETRCCTIC